MIDLLHAEIASKDSKGADAAVSDSLECEFEERNLSAAPITIVSVLRVA
jgi:hypothetical protein